MDLREQDLYGHAQLPKCVSCGGHNENETKLTDIVMRSMAGAEPRGIQAEEKLKLRLWENIPSSVITRFTDGYTTQMSADA